MSKKYAIAALVMGVAGMTCASAQEAQDTTKMRQMQELVVRGVRAQKYAPFAVTNINKTTLEDFGRTGQELPMLFSRTPGVMAWSENGLGGIEGGSDVGRIEARPSGDGGDAEAVGAREGGGDGVLVGGEWCGG